MYSLINRQLLLKLSGAMAMLFAGTYGLAFAWNYEPFVLATAVILLGPQLMIIGWMAQKIMPESKAGWILVLYGFNFACGFPLFYIGPTRASFETWNSNGVWLAVSALCILLNSWQTLYHVDKGFYLEDLKKKRGAGSDTDRSITSGEKERHP